MAKMGQLMLDHGRWQDQQVVSEEWVERSTTALQSAGANGYGYQWWTTDMAAGSMTEGGTAAETKTIRVHSARGNGGQYIFIVPELDAVVVFTGSTYSPLDSSAPFRFMSGVVLPAMM